MKTKICGVTRVEDAEAAVAAGADFLGLNLWASSSRHVAVPRAAEIAAAVRGRIQVVGVFVDATVAEMIAAVAAVKLDVVQLHGSEGPLEARAVRRVAAVWKAFPATREVTSLFHPWKDLALAAALLDTPSSRHGGSGRAFDWDLARPAVDAAPWPVVLAGGLTPDNVTNAIARARPWGVDVASGVERAPGIKDAALMSAFVKAARGLA